MSSLDEKFKKLASIQSSLHNPFEDDVKPRHCKFNDESKAKKKKNPYEFKGLSSATEKFVKEGNTEMDDFFDGLLPIDENATAMSSIVSLGRKYARSHDATEEDSEIDRAFAPQELKLNELFNEVTQDTLAVDKDLTELRMMHSGRNYQRMTELISAKSQLHNTRLSILKEMSSIKKNILDAKSKTNKNGDMNDPNMMSGNIIQSIFGLGHDTLLESVGGREGTDAYVDEYDDPVQGSDEYGDAMCSASGINNTETDGDKFLKYEKSDVKIVLQESDDGTRKVFARDGEGNIVDDYPLPSDIDSLTFEINPRTGTATDQLQRKYVYESV